MLKVTCWCGVSCVIALWCYPAWDTCETFSAVIFNFGMDKAKTKANTIIHKTKLVHLHSKLIHWTNYVPWVDFFYWNFRTNGLRTLSTQSEQKFGKRPQITIKSKYSKHVLYLGASWSTSNAWLHHRALVVKPERGQNMTP